MIQGGYRLLSAISDFDAGNTVFEGSCACLRFFSFFLFSCEGVDQNQSLDELLK
jgi:hypothetical protein